ncbi:MAG TPA: FAD-dependent oxidoreductase [Acidimicrobiales bacterium]|nr:FAD-dependent oxidoreductase [Acidimicrobiales bacterium]
MAPPRPVTVVGGGVSGLTCAVVLAEAGHPVRVVSRDRPADTTSAVAAALWFPYRVLPYDRALAWSRTGYERFADLAAATPAAGVRMRWGVELARDEPGDPWWAAAVPELTVVRDVPPGYRAGWRFAAPVVDMGIYLPWLSTRAAAAGVTTATRALAPSDLADPADPAGLGDLVVDCAGLGTRDLVPDPTVGPVRGQVVVVDQVGIEEWVCDDGDDARLTYVVPRLDEVVVGGTAEDGAWDLRPDPAVAGAILDRAVALVPALAGAGVRRHQVGLRPARPSVRLEAEQREGRTIVHDYGHGGAGVTLSWGCAEEVAALVAGVA